MQPWRWRLPADRTGAQGFSLIEVLIASGLLVTTLASLAHLFIVAMSANVGARDMTYATVLAAQKIEELRAASFPETMAADSTELLDARGRAQAQEAPQPAAYLRRWTVAALPADPTNTVVITVSVSRGAGHRAVRLATIRTRKAP